jgi:parvulin-like peptidyl-prolyl isomerase
MNPRNLAVAVTVTVVAALGAGCSKGGKPEVAAVVEGTKVSSSETETIVDAYLKRQQVAPTGEDVPRDQIAKWVLEYQIRLTFVEQLASSMGVQSEPESYYGSAADLIQPDKYGRIGQRREDFARELRAGKLSEAMAAKVFPNVSISDTAVQAEFDRRSPLLDRHWKATAQLARFGTEEAAKQLPPKAKAGENFEAAARALGADEVTSSEINPVVAPLPAAVLDAVGALAPGAVSDPIPLGPAAWVVVRLEKRQDVPRLTIEDLRPELTGYLAERERHDKFQDWFQQKFTEARVKVDSYYGKWDAKSTVVD